MDDAQKAMLLDPKLWTDTIKKFIEIIKGCLTNKVTKFKLMQWKLLPEELKLRREFARSHVHQFIYRGSGPPQDPPNDNYSSKEIGILLFMFDNVIEFVKSNLCKNTSATMKNVKERVEEAFTLDAESIHGKYSELALDHEKNVKETVYYISGWLLQACKKAATRRMKEIKRQ